MCIARMIPMLQRTRHQILTKYRSGVVLGERAHHRIDYNFARMEVISFWPLHFASRYAFFQKLYS